MSIQINSVQSNLWKSGTYPKDKAKKSYSLSENTDSFTDENRSLKKTTEGLSVYEVYDLMRNSELKSESDGNWKAFDDEGLYDEQNIAVEQEEKTKTEIVVKPDGSRVLVVTMAVGGMETTMSLEISKPTNELDNIRNEEKTAQKQETQQADELSGDLDSDVSV